MKPKKLEINNLITDRLLLIPFTTGICKNLLHNDFSDLSKLGLKKGKSWPDNDVLETLPKILKNLSEIESPTGFESWMIIKKDSLEIIGDAGFKGFSEAGDNVDIGYGIIKEERKKGYAEEAAKALINWAFSTGIVMEITAACLLNNLRSIKLLKKLNFVEIRKDNEMVYWLLKNKEYKKPKI